MPDYSEMELQFGSIFVLNNEARFRTKSPRILILHISQPISLLEESKAQNRKGKLNHTLLSLCYNDLMNVNNKLS